MLVAGGWSFSDDDDDACFLAFFFLMMGCRAENVMVPCLLTTFESSDSQRNRVGYLWNNLRTETCLCPKAVDLTLRSSGHRKSSKARWFDDVCGHTCDPTGLCILFDGITVKCDRALASGIGSAGSRLRFSFFRCFELDCIGLRTYKCTVLWRLTVLHFYANIFSASFEIYFDV